MLTVRLDLSVAKDSASTRAKMFIVLLDNSARMGLAYMLILVQQYIVDQAAPATTKGFVCSTLLPITPARTFIVLKVRSARMEPASIRTLLHITHAKTSFVLLARFVKTVGASTCFHPTLLPITRAKGCTAPQEHAKMETALMLICALTSTVLLAYTVNMEDASKTRPLIVDHAIFQISVKVEDVF